MTRISNSGVSALPPTSPPVSGVQPAQEATPAPALSTDQAALKRPASSLEPQLQSVQAQLKIAEPSPDSAEIERLLNTPDTRTRISSLLQKYPQLKQAFVRHAGGQEVLRLLSQPRLSPAQISQVQRFIVERLQQDISYRGHATGVDGKYGQRTHQALVNTLVKETTAPEPSESAVPVSKPAPSLAPASPQPAEAKLAPWTSLKALNQQLQALPAEQQQRLAQQAPRLRELLQQAYSGLSRTQTQELQTLLVNAGQDISYPGHATGIDGNFGSRSKAALNRVLTGLLASAPAASGQPPVKPAPAQPGPVTQPTPSPVTPARPAEVANSLDHLLRLSADGSLQGLAEQLLRFKDTDLQKLAGLKNQQGDLVQLLQKAAAGPLNREQNLQLQSLLVQAGQDISYPGHPTGIDGNVGKRSRQALLNVAQELLSGQKVAADASPYPRYDRMLEDNLLDMTMAIGYDEGFGPWPSANLAEEAKAVNALNERGFQRDDAKALALLKAAGQTPNASYSAFYVKENVDTHNGKPVHAIVRLIKAGDGNQGAASRQAAVEGMNQSDVFMYGGHARYGNGPDFDRNFTVTINWEGVENAPASGQVTYTDYEALKQLLGKEDSKAIQWLQKLEAAGKVTIAGSNQGNIRMSEKMLRGAEFGAQLMDRALTGVGNTLSEEIQADKYRLWLFNGCRTIDYIQSLAQEARDNPQLKSQQLDYFATEQTLYWENTTRSMVAFLDGVMAKSSGAGLQDRLTAANPEQAATGKTHRMRGFEDNPRFSPQ